MTGGGGGGGGGNKLICTSDDYAYKFLGRSRKGTSVVLINFGGSGGPHYRGKTTFARFLVMFPTSFIGRRCYFTYWIKIYYGTCVPCFSI